MNWGKKIILVLILFILFIGGMSTYMFMMPDDDYDHQYYEKGLAFDHDYSREVQVVKDHAQPAITISDDSVKFDFKQPVKGKVQFLRPSSDAPDKTYTLDSKKKDSVIIPVSKLQKGEWQLVFEWKSSNKSYLYYHEIYIK